MSGLLQKPSAMESLAQRLAASPALKRFPNPTEEAHSIAYTLSDLEGSMRVFLEEDYSPGARIYIKGVGVKTVTDRCPACCYTPHFDNYSTSGQCTGLGSLPSAITVRIY